jgi:hypothetical protein
MVTDAAFLLFWTYVATVVIAGVWGVFGARLDFPVLLGQQVASLDHGAAPNVLSQYRFLRGLEAGFGLFAVTYRRSILSGPTETNGLFLGTMGMGIVGRLVGWAVDGRPRAIMLVFLFGELAGWVCIATSTRVLPALGRNQGVHTTR